MRIRTRWPVRTTSDAVPGNAFAFMVSMLNSVISFGFGRLAPGSMRHSCSMMAKSRSTFLRGPHVEALHAADALQGQLPAVRHGHGQVVAPRASRREPRLWDAGCVNRARAGEQGPADGACREHGAARERERIGIGLRVSAH